MTNVQSAENASVNENIALSTSILMAMESWMLTTMSDVNATLLDNNGDGCLMTLTMMAYRSIDECPLTGPDEMSSRCSIFN